jgi:hypothetical protein
LRDDKVVMGGGKGWRHKLVAEYWKVRGGLADQPLAVPAFGSDEWKDLFSKALCHVHVMLLRDMRPPFIGTRPEMLASNSDTMSRLRVYARATFLKWDATVALTVFGTDIAQTFCERTSVYNLDFGGIVARPLYICGATAADSGPVSDSPGDAATAASFCQNVASMTPLLKFRGEQQQWRCASCAKAGIPANASRRLLRMYPMVPTAHSATPLRSKPLVVALCPPPSDFDWQHRETSIGDSSSIDAVAQPQVQYTSDGNFVVYSEEESKAIWLSSSSYAGLY